MSGVHTRCPDEFNDWVPWELIFHLDRFFCIPDTSHQIDYFAFITSRLAAVAFLSGTITLSITMFLLYRPIRRDLRAYHRAEEMWLKMQELENGDSKDEGLKEEVGLLEGKEQASRLNSYIPRDKLKV